MTVHVLLSSYNRCAYLRGAVESVLAQSYRDLHLLIVDDASTDGTAELAQQYERENPGRVTALCKPVNRGYVDSINMGLAALSSARYVAFHNDDDFWHPQKLEKQMRVLTQRPELGFVATEAMLVDETGAPTGQLFSDVYGELDIERAAEQIFWRGNRVALPSVVVSRPALDLLEPYWDTDGGCNDMDMWLAISARMPVHWIAEPLTYYRVNSGQMSQVNQARMFRETFALRARALARDPALRERVGGHRAAQRLRDDALFRASWSLQHRDMASYAWFARRSVSLREPRTIALLAYHTLRSLILARRADETS